MPSTTQSPQTDTKTALLDAAERLFSEQGIAETSLRAITTAAAANLASVNYHFGSKEGLVRAVFARRLEPLNHRRLDSLARCAEQADGETGLRGVLLAFVEPAMTMMTSQDPGDRKFVRLLGRTLSDPAAEMRSTVLEEFREVSERFIAELCRRLPSVPRQEVVWRFHFMVGALAHTVSARHAVSHQLECLQLPEDEDPRTITDRLVSFLLSGWQGLAGQKGDRV